MKALIAAAGLLALSAGASLAQDATAGARVFNQCRACHQVGETAKNLIGPKLNGLFGRPAGSIEGFNYSPANKNSGITWSDDVFAEYIRDPKAKMPGTKMVYAGLKNEQQVADLTAFLKQYGPDGKTP
jgi:cytochrome c